MKFKPSAYLKNLLYNKHFTIPFSIVIAFIINIPLRQIENKIFKIIVSVILAASLLCILGTACFADLGGFAGNSDFGGDFDADFGDSFDYDYGGSSGDIGDMFYLLYLFDAPPAVIIIVIVLLVLFMIRKKRGGALRHTQRPQRLIQGAQQTNSSLLRPMSEFKSLDREKLKAEFKTKVIPKLYL